jgi:2-oxoacid:acceptor oxidoreductase gamma subunit (pyruvate/2-ketoisovalerate family)
MLDRAAAEGLTEIRLHGRGGQGTVVASLMLARAAMLEGRSVQAFPEFGVERRGAPVTAFLRVADAPISVRCRVERPEHLLVLDPALLDGLEVPEGRGGVFVANTPAPPSALKVPPGWRVATLDATAIARARRLGSGALPVVNSPMAAAFARATGLVGLDALLAAIRENVPASHDENVAAAAEAWRGVRGPLEARASRASEVRP